MPPTVACGDLRERRPRRASDRPPGSRRGAPGRRPNGFLGVFGVTRLPQFQSLSWTVILSRARLSIRRAPRAAGRGIRRRPRSLADRVETGYLLRGIDPGEAVEIGNPEWYSPVAHPGDRLAVS